MKVQIDTEKKIIRVEQNIKLFELMNFLDKIYPDDEWQSFELETNCKIVIEQPITIQPFVQPINILPYIPSTPYKPLEIWCGTTSNGNCSNTLTGTINFEIK